MVYVKQGIAILIAFAITACGVTSEKLLREQETCIGFAMTDEEVKECKVPLNEYEEKKYDRETALIEAQDDFAIREKQCQRRGGFMAIVYRGGKSLKGPDMFQLKMARCVKL